MMNSKILVVDDEPAIRGLLKDILEDEGYTVDVAEHAREANERLSDFLPDLVLLDIWMPEMDGVTLLKQWNEEHKLGCPVVMMSGHGTVETAVEATRFGALDFVEKPLSMAKLLRTVKTALNNRAESNEQLKPEQTELPIGNSRKIQALRDVMQVQARHLSPVFFVGQAGSEIRIWVNHLCSLQKNSTSIQAFKGDINQYRHGILDNIYIEEVADLSMEQQRILLTLLQQPILPASTGRVIASSTNDYDALRNMSELLPELAEFWRTAIYIPTLNDRIEDIPELLEYYVNWISENEALPYRHFGVAAQNMIRNYPWQGGLSELKNVIRRILSNSTDDRVELEEIRHFLQPGSGQSTGRPSNSMALTLDLDMDLREAREYFEREYLRQQLQLCQYNVSELARKVGQERTNIYRKLKSLGLNTRKP